MKTLHEYLHDLARLAQQLGVFIGTLLILFATPGIVVMLIVRSPESDVLPWFSPLFATFCLLMCGLGVTFVFLGMRNSVHFGVLSRLRLRRRRAD